MFIFSFSLLLVDAYIAAHADLRAIMGFTYDTDKWILCLNK